MTLGWFLIMALVLDLGILIITLIRLILHKIAGVSIDNHFGIGYLMVIIHGL